MSLTQVGKARTKTWNVDLLSPKALFQSAEISLLCAEHIEGQFYERKSKHPPEKLAETICAFANSNQDKGGLLAVGISDDGTIDGLVHRPDVNLNSLLRYHHFTGTPTRNKLVDCTNRDGNKDRVLVSGGLQVKERAEPARTRHRAGTARCRGRDPLEPRARRPRAAAPCRSRCRRRAPVCRLRRTRRARA